LATGRKFAGYRWHFLDIAPAGKRTKYNAHPIIRSDANGNVSEYPSVYDAAFCMKVTAPVLYAVLRRGLEKGEEWGEWRGYRWKYRDGDFADREKAKALESLKRRLKREARRKARREACREARGGPKRKSNSCRPVIRSGDGKVFRSLLSAANYMKCTEHRLRKALRKGAPRAAAVVGGYRWAYHKLRASQPVERSDGRTYSSAKAAAKSMKISLWYLQRAIRLGRPIAGFGWSYAAEPPVPLESPVSDDLPGPLEMPVLRSDGYRFQSVWLAAKAVGIDPWRLRRAIRRGKPVAGFDWSYAEEPDVEPAGPEHRESGELSEPGA
jgi:hypothetical protein